MPEFFTEDRRNRLRREVLTEGLIVDEYLAADPDTAVFGLNIACAYPFPAPLSSQYTVWARGLARLGEGIAVYQPQQTHITLATLWNFTSQGLVAQRERLSRFVPKVVAVFEGEFRRLLLSALAFDLEVQTPVLTRRAVIIPFADAAGAVVRVRERLMQAIQTEVELEEGIEVGGFNVPSIVHATVARFKGQPADLDAFCRDFDNHGQALPPVVIRVNEVFLTAETRPYMRAGEIVARIKLRD